MEFSKPIIDIIQERISHRTYSGHSLEKNLGEKVLNLLENHDSISPFSKYAGKARFRLLSIPEFNSKDSNLAADGLHDAIKKYREMKK